MLCAEYTSSQGRCFRNVRIEMTNGRVIRLTCANGTDVLQSRIENADDDPDVILGSGIGINTPGIGMTGKPTLDARLEDVATSPWAITSSSGEP